MIKVIKITSTEKPAHQENSMERCFLCLGCTKICQDKVLSKALSGSQLKSFFALPDVQLDSPGISKPNNPPNVSLGN